MVNSAKPVSPAPHTFFYGWIIVISSFFVLLAYVFMSNSTGVFFKPMLKEMGWSRAMTAGAFSVSTIVSGVSAPFMGVLSDKYGPRVMGIGCAVLLGAGYLMASMSDSLITLYIAIGLLIGLGSGAMWTPVAATAARWFVARRGIALSLIQVGAGLGTVIGPPLATFITYRYDWRHAFLILGLSMALLTLIAVQFLRRSPQEMGLSPDGGTVDSSPSRKITGSAVTKSITLTDALRMSSFWKIFLANAGANFAQQVMVVHLVAAATDRDITPAMAATFLSVVGVTNMTGKVLMGIVSDRVGRRISLTISLSLAAFAMFWLVISRDPWMFYAFAVIWGFAYGSWIPMFPAFTGDLYGVNALGGIFGVVTLGNAIGGAAGAFLAGAIFDKTQSYTIVFILSATLLIMGVSLILAIKDPKRVKQKSTG